MTHEQYREEWKVVYQTRLGMMCENGKPTERQKQIAKIEADEHIEKLRKQHDHRNNH